jgi:TonB family protein
MIASVERLAMVAVLVTVACRAGAPQPPDAGPAPAAPVVVSPGDVRPDSAILEELVERKPELLRMPRLEYPDSLRRAGIQGSVLLEFILDTLGRAEPASIQVLYSSHPAFSEAARRAVAAARFRPAELGGRPVRVILRLPLDFKLRARQ